MAQCYTCLHQNVCKFMCEQLCPGTQVKDLLTNCVSYIPAGTCKVTLYQGNIFDSDAPLLVHQVNCKGVMGGGLAKQIRTRYPKVFDKYVTRCGSMTMDNRWQLLGTAQFVEVADGRWVANCFGQFGFGIATQHTDYSALFAALKEVASMAIEHELPSVAIPHGLGCGLGGGEWQVVLGLIHQAFASYTGVVQIWQLPM